ncbi:MAG: hypothetical protein QXY05_00420 [Candidatus Anstonellales archaeon]
MSMGIDKDSVVEKIETGPLQKFKNQNIVLKKFGKDALKVYNALDGKKTLGEIAKESGLEEGKVLEMVNFMLEKGVASAKGEELTKPKAEPTKIEVGEEKKVEEIKPEIPEEKEEIVVEKGEVAEVLETKEPEEIKPAIKPIEAEKIEEEKPKEEKELTPVDKIIYDKYGKIGLEVYNRIDGIRTAEQIMSEVGISEEKLVEILNFLEEKGIIKLEHPEKKKKVEEKKERFGPITGELGEVEEEERLPTEVSPIEVPIKSKGTDVIKGIKARASILISYGNEGGKIFDSIDGKNDVIQISKKLRVPIYTVKKILKELEMYGVVVLKPLTRKEIRKRYGEDAYTIFKKYGLEGVMLYELIGGEMNFKQMADMIYAEKKEKANVVDMFLFIHKVLGIELPVDKELLYKQLGLEPT